MQVDASIFLDLKLVNVQNTRSVVFMQGEMTSEFLFIKRKISYVKFQVY